MDAAAGTALRGAPRLLLNSLAPVAGYYVASRLEGVVAGVIAATAISLALWARERRAGRPGLVARLALGLVLVQATAGLLTQSAFLFFAPKAMADILEGLAHYVSCLTRWPLAAIFARELVTVPRATLGEPCVRRLLVRITLVWGTYFTLRGIVTLSVLALAGTETYLLVRALIDAPVVIPLAVASLAYGSRRIRALSADAGPRAAVGEGVS
jgi:hypothetical protein